MNRIVYWMSADRNSLRHERKMFDFQNKTLMVSLLKKICTNSKISTTVPVRNSRLPYRTGPAVYRHQFHLWLIYLFILWSSVFQKSMTYFDLFVLRTCLAIAIMTFFAISTYRNAQEIPYWKTPLVKHELDKQLIVMVLVEVFCKIVFIAPLII